MRTGFWVWVLALVGSWVGAEDTSIRIGGSTTMLPIVAKCAATFMDKYPTWDRVDRSLPKTPVIIYVTGGGSGFGVRTATDGTCHIGLASRDLKKEEQSKIGAHTMTLISMDCLAFAVNKQHPLASKANLTRNEAARIFSGEAKTAKDVDGSLAEIPLLLLLRNAASSATEMVQKDVLKERKFSPQALQIPSMGAIARKLEANEKAIGYVSSVLALQSERLKALKYEGVEPSNENVLAGKYVLVRPFYLLVKGKPDARIQAFLDFCTTEGQKIVEEQGYIPIKSAK